MRLVASLGLLAVLGVALFSAIDMQAFAQWAMTKQREFQNAMAGSVRGLRAGETGAWAGLLAAAAAYGFVHAVGPGHGKYLIGGVGVGSSVSAQRLVTLALISSLMQSLWAIVLVYGGLAVLAYSAHELTALAEGYLAPASYLAVAAVGAVLVWRGARALTVALRATDSAPEHECGCKGHGPTPDDVAKLHSLKDSIMLIASVAIRPCTGAIFLLIITWNMDIRLAGAVAVVVMGLGTAGLTTTVAVSSVVARGVALAAVHGHGTVSTVLAAFQVVSGVAVIWISVLLLRLALGA